MSDPARAASVNEHSPVGAPRERLRQDSLGGFRAPCTPRRSRPRRRPRSRIRIASSSTVHVERVRLGVPRPVEPLGAQDRAARCDVALGTSLTQTAMFTPCSLLDPGSPADYLPMNARLALLGEGVEALLRVPRSRRGSRTGRPRAQSSRRGRRAVLVRRLLRIGDGDGTLRGDLRGHPSPRLRHQVVLGVDALHEATARRPPARATIRPVRITSLAKPRDVVRASRWRAAPAGHDPEVHLGLAEHRVLGAEPDVARQRHLAAAAERVAVDGRDGGLAHRLEAVRDILAELAVGARLERRLGGQLGDARRPR